MHVVWKDSTHETILDPREPVLLHSLLGILNRIKHDECVVAMFEKWPKNLEKGSMTTNYWQNEF